MSEIAITLKDGTARAFAAGVRGDEVAASVSPRFAAAVAAMEVDGVPADLSAPLSRDCRVLFVRRDDDAALELIRHDCAHILAQAVCELYPGTLPTIGPAVADGFYYDFYRDAPFTPDDLEKIEARMREIVDEDIPLVREVWARDDAISFFEKRGDKFKAEIIRDIPQSEEISVYRQGSFLDLCRGPHLPSTRFAGKAFKLLRVAGSYWRGDAKRESLQRIYGTAWRADKELRAYLHQREEAERRDHRRLGREMNLFHFQDEAAGQAFWHDGGATLYRELQGYMRRRLQAAGYQEVKTPQLVARKLWEDSGHWEKFREFMYLAESEEGVRAFAAADEKNNKQEEGGIFALKPMNCPCHVQIYKQGVKSYRDLPLRMAEFGSCHRAEPSGALHGLMRARAFVQDDAHIFCAEEDVCSESAAFCDLLRSVYADLGFADLRVNFADRPPLRAGADDVWDRAETALTQAAAAAGLECARNPGEGAFYGPKLEFILRDAIGREWQCGTLQVDFVLPERLDAEYAAADGARRRPVMLHRAIIGSFERFIGILIEHTAGRLPLWLAPKQAVIATITDAAADYAQEVCKLMNDAGLRAAVDLRNEKINYKVREHLAAKTPALLAVGKREVESRAVSVRRLGCRDTKTIPLADAIAALAAEAKPPA
jgi:threonyl-tRNA synthetase